MKDIDALNSIFGNISLFVWTFTFGTLAVVSFLSDLNQKLAPKRKNSTK